MAHASILLLEDDPSLRELLRDVLALEGFPVRACASIEEVFRGSGDGEIAVALVDAWGESHAVLTEAERHEIQEVARAVPTIMVTGRQWAQTVAPAELGLLGLVRKPFDIDELVGVIKRSIDALVRESAQAPAKARRLRGQVEDAQEALTRAAQRLEEVADRAGHSSFQPRGTRDQDAAPTDADRRLFRALHRLLALDAADVKTALTDAAQQIAETLGAEKFDVFLHEPTSASLVALGTSKTRMGILQHQLGLHRQPIASGGSAVRIFRTRQSLLASDTRDEGRELVAVVEQLGVRAQVGVPISVRGERRGVLLACSATPGVSRTTTGASSKRSPGGWDWSAIVRHRTSKLSRDPCTSA